MTTNKNLLRDRVAFDKRADAIEGEAGGTPGDWVEQFQEACALTWLRGSEPVIAQRLQGVNPVVIKIRSSTRARMIDASWRARLPRKNNRLLNIRSIIPDDRDFYLELTCEAGVASG